jgi:RNA polymerase II subunit A small phosphatase-like protein
MSRTVLVDNNPFSFLLQPHNGIPVVPFTGGAMRPY